MRQRSTAEPIGNIVKNVVEKLSSSRKANTQKILTAWPSIAGKELTRHTRPASLKKGILKIFVDESAWIYQANLKKQILLKALKKKIGQEKVRDIYFRIGKV